MPSRALLLVVLLATLLASCAEPPAPLEPPRTLEDPPTPVASERLVVPSATGAVAPRPDPLSEASIQAHLQTLASDAMEGRQTLQPGAERAAATIEERLACAGLQPLPGHQELRVPYTLWAREIDTNGAGLEVEGELWREGEEVSPLDVSTEAEVTAPVVFAGYGITAPELGHDDYAGLDVRGRVVLVLRHHPHEGEAGPWTRTKHAWFKTKAQLARRRGAAGLLVVTDPAHHDASDDLRVDPGLRLSPGGEVASTRGVLPAAQISRALAERLIRDDERSLRALQDAVDAGTRPATLAVGGPPVRFRLRTHGQEVRREAHNVIGFLRGAERPDEWVVVGAHYDHVGAYHGAGDTVFNGADDNASGTAGLLAIAEAMARAPTPPRRSVVFAAFSGEEDGLLGSEAMVREGVLPPGRVVAMVNLDMIGRNPERPVSVYGHGTARGFRALVEEANDRSGARLALRFEDKHPDNSDHHSFHRRQVPYLFFFTGYHDDYHERTDHADRIAWAHLTGVVRLAWACTDALARAERAPRKP